MLSDLSPTDRSWANIHQTWRPSIQRALLQVLSHRGHIGFQEIEGLLELWVADSFKLEGLMSDWVVKAQSLAVEQLPFHPKRIGALAVDWITD